MGPQINVDILPPSVVEKWAQTRKIQLATAPRLPALLDTGASITGVDEDVLKKLRYPPIGVANLSTPSGTTTTSIYMIRLVIPSRIDPGFPPNIPRIIVDNVYA